MRCFLALLFFLYSSFPALAAVCGDRSAIIPYIKKERSQKLLWRGIDNKNYLVEIYSNKDTTNWFQVITSIKKKSCIIDVGDGSEVIPELPNEPFKQKTNYSE